MKNDNRVKTWHQLVAALYHIPKTHHQRYRSNFVYRGVANKEWGLETSLKRLGPAYLVVERPLIRNFAKYAQPGEIPSSALWFRLAVAQHHGLPTRLMDWTVSPRVATHFATFEEEHYDKDGAIWAVDVVNAIDYLPPEFQATLKEESAFLFSIEMLDRLVSSLPAFDALSKKGEFVLFFEPPSLDARIINQGAIMSVMPGAHFDLRSFLTQRASANLYHRIIIPKGLKWEIRDKLDQDNVTERMLFPGLDGLSRWLKRYYGPGPTVKPSVHKRLPSAGRDLP
jgi:hypothetical protein